MTMKFIPSRLRHFGRETRGSVSVEFLLMMPMLFWAFMA
jgi:Flp pilus assembly protein TadG